MTKRFNAALRTLDRHPADNADDGHLWEGGRPWSGISTRRRNENFRSHDWPKEGS
jgi:hypothetical protein